MSTTVISHNIVNYPDGYDTTQNETVIVDHGVYVVGKQVGMDAAYSTDVVYNFGHIISTRQDASNGFDQGVAGGAYFVNERSGRIKGNIGALVDGTFINKGEITGRVDGVDLVDTFKNFTNSGSIIGQTFGIEGDTGGNVIRNSGTISGQTALSLFTGNVRFALVNSGTISGQVEFTSYQGDGHEAITNTGTIDGDVTFADGTNYFDGRGGTVSGTVTGGDGVDVLRAGDGAETLAGGAGHDRLYAGTGADTFAFSSHAAADLDQIIAFNATRDTIQLDSADFAGLTPGTTPEFVDAAHAIGANDHLFYNAGNGYLYYDADGQGGAQAQAYAFIGKGLHLTGADFKVV